VRPPTNSGPVPSTAAEAPTGFDNRSNGAGNDSIHQADQEAFDEVEEIADGLGPLYNAQACRECHQNPPRAERVRSRNCGWSSGTGWAVPQRRHPDRARDGCHFRSHARQRSGHLPQRRAPGFRDSRASADTETIRTTRASLNLLGDGWWKPSRRDADRDRARAAPDDAAERSAARRSMCRSWKPGGNPHRAVRLEGSARQSAVVLSRCLPQ